MDQIGRMANTLTGKCCDNGTFNVPHLCQKQPQSNGAVNSADMERTTTPDGITAVRVNGAGIELSKLRASTGRPKGTRNLHAKHPSSLARRFKAAGLDWAQAFALAIRGASNFQLPPAARRQAREDVRMWLRLLPYMITQTNHSTKVKKWKGKASRAAIVALDALEGR